MVIANKAIIPSIDLGLGALPLYILLFAFAFSLVMFLRRAIRDSSVQDHRILFLVTFIALAAVIVYAFTAGCAHLFSQSFTWILLLIFMAVSFLLQIFKRAFGSLLVCCCVLLILAVVLFIRSLTAFTGRTLIANIHAITADGKEMHLLVEPRNGSLPGQEEAFSVAMQGDHFGLFVYQIIFDDAAVFLGAKTRYAWLGMTSFESIFTQKDKYLFPDALSRAALFDTLERRELTLPFVRSVQADIAIKAARPKMRYAVWIENDGGVTITSLGEEEEPEPKK
ncbi:MAG: hypothetical protein LBC99_00270 [Spirochaetota bacterium]|nr:hypothetical protein [Spirochaetota bacterium]